MEKMGSGVMRPRASVLAGEEGAGGGAVVGDGGAGVRGGTELRGFRGEKGRSLKEGDDYHGRIQHVVQGFWCFCCGGVGVSRGRVSHHRELADLRHKGDAGNGQKVERVRRYFGNGAEAGKGWEKCGRGVRYWPGKKGQEVVVWWVMEEMV